MLGQFKIIIPSFNSVKYLPKTLQSIEIQNNKNFDVCIIDDASTLPNQKEIIQEFCERNGWKSIYQTKNRGALVNILEGVDKLNCKNEDVIILLDGDDWLANDNVLDALEKAYTSPNVWMTYGSYESSPNGVINLSPAKKPPDDIIDQQLHRKIRWVFQVLHSFKYHLWKRIKDQDLRDTDGEYFRVCYDRALLYPMMEMAGHRLHYIDEILYIYNLENPLNDHKINRDEQLRVELHIRSLPKYPLITEA